MARKWWQFSNWPDGTSGDAPDVKDQDPNAVEEWAPNSLPKPCTLFRQEWLNQFVAWKYYLTRASPPDASTWWLKAYDGSPPAWCNTVMVNGGRADCGLQNPGFWEWLATLDTGGSAMYPGLHMIPLPNPAPGGTLEVTPANNAQRGFVAGQAFAARKFQPYGPSGNWDLDLPLPPLLYLGSRHVTVNNNIHSYGTEWTLAGANLQAVLTGNEQSETDAENGLFFASFLWQIRNRFDSMSVMFDNQAPIVEIGDRYGWWYDETNGWEPHTHSKYSTYPIPSYRDPNTNELVRDVWPYANSDGGTYTNFLMNGVGCGWGGGKSRVAVNDIVRQIDACWLTDTNYRYALISMEDKDDPERFQNPPGGVPLPDQYGYCHAAFELPTYINLNTPASVIVNVLGGGVGGSGWIGTPDLEADEDYDSNAIYAERSIRLVSYPYDIIPDAYKGPDWPTVSEEDEHGDAVVVPYLSNDRHNRWLDNNQPA